MNKSASDSTLGNRGETAPSVGSGAVPAVDMLQRPMASDGASSVAPCHTTARNTNPDDIGSENQMTIPYRYLILKRKDGLTFEDVSPFLMNKGLYGLFGELEMTKKVREGILVETKTEKQSLKIQNTTKFLEYDIETTPHKTMNRSRGVIYCPDLLNCTIENIKEELKSQKVIDVVRIKSRKSGSLQETPNHILTFDTPTLPKKINVSFYSLKVRLFIPSPLRCFRCQKFGHRSTQCESIEICVCGKPLHEGHPCKGPIQCINCGGSHSVRSEECSVFKQELAIQEFKT